MKKLILVLSLLYCSSVYSQTTIVDYKGINVQSPAPTGTAGLRIDNNFKELADRVGPCNFSAVVAPTANDDIDGGYEVGSFWYDTVTHILYWCADNANGAAVWINVIGTSHDSVTLSTDLGNNLLGISSQQITLDNQSANRIFAGPATGAAAAPTFRSLVADDVPDLSSVYQSADADLTTYAGITPSANIQSLLAAADYATARTSLGLGTASNVQFATLGIGRAPNANYPLMFQQSLAGYGAYFYPPSGTNGTYIALDANGNAMMASSAQATFQGATNAILKATGGYAWVASSANQVMLLDAGGLFTFRDVDATNATRLTINSATGELAIPSNTVGLKLGAAGGTTIIADASNLTFTDPTTGAKTLAQLAQDTTYTAGDGLLETAGDFDVRLKSGGGLEFDTDEIRLSTAEAPATATDTDDAETIDFSANAIHKITLDNDTGPCVLTFTDPPAGSRCILILIQDADGGETVTWPAGETIYWAGGTAPTLSTGASARDVITLLFDGTDYYCTGYAYATP